MPAKKPEQERTEEHPGYQRAALLARMRNPVRPKRLHHVERRLMDQYSGVWVRAVLTSFEGQQHQHITIEGPMKVLAGHGLVEPCDNKHMPAEERFEPRDFGPNVKVDFAVGRYSGFLPRMHLETAVEEDDAALRHFYRKDVARMIKRWQKS